jgi:hypothetical protein
MRSTYALMFTISGLVTACEPVLDTIDAPPGTLDAAVTDSPGCVVKTWYADCDGDGIAGIGAATQSACEAPAPSPCGGGWSMKMPIAGAADCNDTRADVHPGATEICDSVDNDCDGQIDEDGLTTFYRDSDGDGHGNAAASMTTCMKPSGYVVNSDDCNDARADIYPGHAEICDSVDNNCNNSIDEGVQLTYYRDADSDNHGTPGTTTLACTQPSGYVTSNDDCNDARADIYPGHAEICDGVDNNCNSSIDEGVTTTFYRDADGDGYGNPAQTIQACSAPVTYVANNTDCDDAVNSTHPGATEVCFNAADDNCNGAQDEATECSIDCNWSGAHWLSHGWDGNNAFFVGAWVTCSGGKLNYMDYVLNNPPGTGVNPSATGTSDPIVGCNWAGSRWGSQGWDGSNAFTFGVDVACSGARVTNLNWGNDLLQNGQTAVVTTGKLGCDWTGAIYFTHGRDGSCAFVTGFNVTCNNNHITNFEVVEGANCARTRD